MRERPKQSPETIQKKTTNTEKTRNELKLEIKKECSYCRQEFGITDILKVHQVYCTPECREQSNYIKRKIREYGRVKDEM
jgi:hypothetical protein